MKTVLRKSELIGGHHDNKKHTQITPSTGAVQRPNVDEELINCEIISLWLRRARRKFRNGGMVIRVIYPEKLLLRCSGYYIWKTSEKATIYWSKADGKSR